MPRDSFHALIQRATADDKTEDEVSFDYILFDDEEDIPTSPYHYVEIDSGPIEVLPGEPPVRRPR